jgi:hypothetical protein
LTIGGAAQAQDSAMTFFLATNPGKGGDLGGLTGADARCQSLAKEANAGGKTWRAYLSTSGEGGQAAVNARDRIGKGPWRNAKGVVIAKDVEELHANPNINFDTALTAKGEPVNSRRLKPNYHDILTARRPTAARFLRTRATRRAATGRAAARARRSSATTIAKGCATTRPRSRGTRRIRRAAAVSRR